MRHCARLPPDPRSGEISLDLAAREASLPKIRQRRDMDDGHREPVPHLFAAATELTETTHEAAAAGQSGEITNIGKSDLWLFIMFSYRELEPRNWYDLDRWPERLGIRHGGAEARGCGDLLRGVAKPDTSREQNARKAEQARLHEPAAIICIRFGSHYHVPFICRNWLAHHRTKLEYH